jgi:cyclopropane fatty-acyl-phospholipid synthase-like methyltransferase
LDRAPCRDLFDVLITSEQEVSSELLQSYETFPYRSLPFPQSHPDRLATIGALFGMTPVPIARSRVLEIGCASGGNLIPIAASLPEAEFVGVDLSPVQVRQGVADIDALGLSNIRILAMNLMDFGEEFGVFDYIIAHGVYSWIPTDAQDRMLAICARQLSPSGIAYISYNTLPGWRMRAVVRDAMIYHTRRLVEPTQQVAQSRAMLEFLAEALKDDASPYGGLLRHEAEQLRKQEDYYILHDYLEAVNEPLYFYQFMERAARHGLNYLGEADFGSMLGSEFGPTAMQTLANVAPDVLNREQYMDFLRARVFRQTLLVRSDVELTRKLSPLRVMTLRMASRAQRERADPGPLADAVETFRTPGNGEFRVAAGVTKAALLALAETWPLAIAFDELLSRARARLSVPAEAPEDERRQLASDILQCYAAGAIELHHAPSPFVIDPGERPEASAVARLQVARGTRATTLRHEAKIFGDDARRLLMLLDGSRTRTEIAQSYWPGRDAAESGRELDRALAWLGRFALLVR